MAVVFKMVLVVVWKGFIIKTAICEVNFFLPIIKNTFHLKDDAVSGVLGVCNARNFPETDHILF